MRFLVSRRARRNGLCASLQMLPLLLMRIPLGILYQMLPLTSAVIFTHVLFVVQLLLAQLVAFAVHE